MEEERRCRTTSVHNNDDEIERDGLALRDGGWAGGRLRQLIVLGSVLGPGDGFRGPELHLRCLRRWSLQPINSQPGHHRDGVRTVPSYRSTRPLVPIHKTRFTSAASLPRGPEQLEAWEI